MENSRFMAQARQCLEIAKHRTLSNEERRELAIDLAGFMLSEARRIQTRQERISQQQLALMVNDPIGKTFITSMTDQCFRSNNPYRVADQLIFLLNKYGIPRFLSIVKRMPFSIFKLVGHSLAKLFVPLTKRTIRKETTAVIVPGEAEQLNRHMLKRRLENVRLNMNHLGEAILGEDEAKNRLNTYLNDLSNPNIEYISVKISTICSQLNLLSWEQTLAILSSRLKQLYRASQQHLYMLPDGRKVPKFVNLDMEEYRDLHLTVDLFQRVLDDAEFYNYSAGIVLQSYIPDSFLIQQDLTTWAMKRVANGGAPIKIRIVKGANLSMEQVEASIRGWEQAPYITKSETDANFKRMVIYGCEPERAKAAFLGIGSHNLFDIALALLLRTEKKLEKYICFEMLEGMADPMRRVVQDLSKDMLLYCPIATQEEFQYAVAYLMRRLDENTAPANFLRHAFDLAPGTKEWKNQADLFSQALHTRDWIAIKPRRQQNRYISPERRPYAAPFSNEPDTDWSLPQNRKWAETIIREWSVKQFSTLPMVLGSQEIISGVELGIGIDPSYPDQTLYQYALAGKEQLAIAIRTASQGLKSWSAKPLRERSMLLDEIAHQLRCGRADLIGAMVADTGKTISEADVEVSEAIDFASYYRRNAEEFHFLEDIRFEPKGPVLVASPWNFPCSIPAGGILAALAAGNSVIFKPAPEAVLVGWQLVNLFWKAGIDKEVLQFFNCHDDPVGSLLIQDPRLSAVILTGATSTAKHFLKLRPGIDLLAETGGKNTFIVTEMADRDLAIKDIIQSSFGHAGQKCSACSLLILEKEVYHDSQFLENLRDAAASLNVGPPWDLSTRINPLINPPNPNLLRGLTQLEEGEEWLLKPEPSPSNPRLWSPGIKIGVRQGSFTHQTELFGPVLGVMCADHLEEALTIANSTPYGLTAGIHTLDEREQVFWKERIVAGNCYINRTITGAIVLRQPFGGCKESSFGPGAKAGGPNYLAHLMKAKQIKMPKEKESLDQDVLAFDQEIDKSMWTEDQQKLWTSSLGSYAFYWSHYFVKSHDPSQVLGQDNLLSYVPHSHQVLRVQNEDLPFDVFRSIAAALTCKASFKISLSKEKAEEFPEGAWRQSSPMTIETEEQLIQRINNGGIKRMRLLSECSFSLKNALANAACHTINAHVLANGRLELLNYLREVSTSLDYHRYGYLGVRANN